MKLKNVIKTSISKSGSFQAGNIKHLLENWKRITSDKYILDIGDLRKPFQVTYNSKENGINSREICRLLKKKVTVQTIAVKEDFFSSVSRYFYELTKMRVTD